MSVDATPNTLPRSRAAGYVPAAALLILLAAALAWWLVSPPPSTGPGTDGRKPPRLESTVDASIPPGDDFFAYANGAWLKATAIPAGKERWGCRDQIEAENRRRIAELLEAASAAPAGSGARKVADFQAAYLNEAAIEARGLASLQPLLDRIEKVSDKADLTRMLGRSMRADVDPMGFGVYKSAGVLGLSVEQSIHGEKTNTAFLVQGGLGLPDREDYLRADPGKEALRARYLEYIRTMLTLAGFGHADERAAAVLTLETALAQSQATREASANDHNADNVWTRSDFARQAPGMDWTVFFDGAELAGQAELRRLAADRRDRTGGAGRVAAAGRLEGLPALPCHPRFRGRAAARICRAGPGAARGFRSRATALPSRARPRGHPIGHGKCAREGCTPSAISPPRRRSAWSESPTTSARRSRNGSRPRRGCRRPPKRARCRSCRRCTWGSGIPISGRTILRYRWTRRTRWATSDASLSATTAMPSRDSASP